mgnify:CR=1 FL=1
MFLDIFANVVAILVNLVLGLRLLQLGREPDRAPEYLLGLCLTFDGIEWLLWLLAAYTPLVDTPLGNALGYLCRAGLCASVICLLAFNQTVFRPGSALGRAAVVIASIIMLIGLIGSGLVGVCYVLDEPSIGLHPRDNRRLIEALRLQGAPLYITGDSRVETTINALNMLTLRRLVMETDGLYKAVAEEDDMLAYYANSIVHWLPDGQKAL